MEEKVETQKSLNLEKNHLLSQIALIKSELEMLVTSWPTIEAASEQAFLLEHEIEQDAWKKAQQITKNCEEKIALLDLDKIRFEQRIIELQTELQMATGFAQHLNLLDSKSVQREEIHIDNRVREHEDSSVYSINMISFVNARHFVAFGDKVGPVHAHSWQISLEVLVPSGKEMVAFAKLSQKVKSSFSPFENTVLNYVYPFTIIHPTTENMALYFYNQLEDSLTEIGLELGKISLWETPTRGIEVTNRFLEFDQLLAEKGSENSEISEGMHPEELSSLENKQEQETAAATEELLDVKDIEINDNDSDKDEANHRHRYVFWELALFAIGVCLFWIFFYSPLLVLNEEPFPWTPKALWHLEKAEQLYALLMQGQYFSVNWEHWSNGLEFSHLASPAYYLIAIARVFSPDIQTAGGIYTAVCSLIGGLSWLLLAKRIRLWPAFFAAVVWLIWLNNLRITFIEGDLTLAAATGLLPMFIALTLNVSEKKAEPFSLLGWTVLIFIIGLINLKLSAVIGFSVLIFLFLYWLYEEIKIIDALILYGLYIFALMATVWFYYPVIAALNSNPEFSSKADTFAGVPFSVMFNPAEMIFDEQVFYWGFSLMAALVLVIVFWSSRPKWAKCLSISGLIMLSLNFTFIYQAKGLLPFDQMLSSEVMASWTSAAVIAAVFGTVSSENHQSGSSNKGLIFKHKAVVWSIAAFIILLGDSFSVFKNHFLDAMQFEQPASVPLERNNNEQSRLIADLRSNTTSSLLSAIGEQGRAFGWVWNGGSQAGTVFLTNEGFEQQFYSYLVRYNLFHDLKDLYVWDKSLLNEKEFKLAADSAGYRNASVNNGFSHWRRNSELSLFEKPYKGLVIGHNAALITLRFPMLEAGHSPYLDEYDADELNKYPMIILSGVKWNLQSAAEQIALQYVKKGGRLVVDLGDVPKSILSKQPKFLDVYGESVSLPDSLAVFGRDKNYFFKPYEGTIPFYTSFIPMGLDERVLGFDYFGNTATVYGYKQVAEGRIEFLGASVLQMAVFSGQTGLLEMMKDILKFDTSFPIPKSVTLEQATHNDTELQFTYSISEDRTVVVPISRLIKTDAYLDNIQTTMQPFEDLWAIKLPAGSHQVKIIKHGFAIDFTGLLISLVSCVGLAILYFWKLHRGGAGHGKGRVVVAAVTDLPSAD